MKLSTSLIKGCHTCEFEVVEDYTSLSLTIKSSRPCGLVGTLYDSNNDLRGSICGPLEVQTYVVSKLDEETSYSFRTGDIPKGNWEFTYLLKEDLEVEIEINFYEKTPESLPRYTDRVKLLDEEGYSTYLKSTAQIYPKATRTWYKGDFHSHSTESDGSLSPYESHERARIMGLDFYLPSDHNITPTYWHDDPVVYPALELTTDFGDCNIIFMKELIFEALSLEDLLYEDKVLEFLSKDPEGDYLRVFVHPFQGDLGWLIKDVPLTSVDAIEIINDPSYPMNKTANLTTLAFWDILLNDGWQIPAIGGSDTHMKPKQKYEGAEFPSLLGNPNTWLYADSLSLDSLKDALINGRVVVSRSEGLLKFSVDNQVSGTRFSYKIGSTYNVEATFEVYEYFREEDLRLELVKDAKVLATSNGKLELTCEVKLEEGSYSWLRAQVIHKEEGLVACSNPVYFGSRESKLKTWQDACSKLNI